MAMTFYASLLKASINEVAGVQEQIGLDSLANPGGTTMLADSIKQQNNIVDTTRTIKNKPVIT